MPRKYVRVDVDKRIVDVSERDTTPLCKWLNANMESHNMKSFEVAAAIGVSKNLFCAWRTGRQVINIKHVFALAKLFGGDMTYARNLKFDELYGEEWRTTDELGELTGNEVELVKLMRKVGGNPKLNDDQKERIKQILEEAEKEPIV